MITFDPLWKTLKEKNISQYKLLNDYNMSRGMLDNIKHNRSITLNQFCEMFDCDIADIIEYKKDK